MKWSRWKTCCILRTLACSSTFPSTEQYFATAARAASVPVGGRGYEVDQCMGGGEVERMEEGEERDVLWFE